MLGDDRPYHSLLVSVEQAFLFPPWLGDSLGVKAEH